jgi:hypothetical protein
MANSKFYDFGSLSEEMAQSGKNSSIGITFDAGEFTFEGHHGEEYGFPITGEFKINDRTRQTLVPYELFPWPKLIPLPAIIYSSVFRSN